MTQSQCRDNIPRSSILMSTTPPKPLTGLRETRSPHQPLESAKVSRQTMGPRASGLIARRIPRSIKLTIDSSRGTKALPTILLELTDHSVRIERGPRSSALTHATSAGAAKAWMILSYALITEMEAVTISSATPALKRIGL